MDKPLVSIVIPTYNSEKTLPICLESIKRQISRNIEVIVVDNYSKDRTIKIAEKFGARIIRAHGGLLWARYIGHLHAQGDIELLLDSDQILNPTTIEQGVKMILNGCDMLVLEEQSYNPKTLMQWLFYFDRKQVHNVKDLNPLHGVLLARMYRYEVLDKAFNAIKDKLPLKLMYRLVSQDHALIYYEAWKYSKKIAILDNAVYHIEPFTLTQVIKKFYRYGKTELSITKYYPELIRGKRTPRKINLRPESWVSLLLWLMKAVPYALGKATSSYRICDAKDLRMHSLDAEVHHSVI